MPLLEQIVKAGKKLSSMSEDVEGEALPRIILNKLRGTLHLHPASRPPDSATCRKEMLRDIAS